MTSFYDHVSLHKVLVFSILYACKSRSKTFPFYHKINIFWIPDIYEIIREKKEMRQKEKKKKCYDDTVDYYVRQILCFE
jgi:hypothetical protein